MEQSVVMTLGDAGIAVLDCEHKTPRPSIDGFPYIAIPDIQDGRVITDTARKISETDLQVWNRRNTPKEGDIIVTRRGRVGDTAPIPKNLRCAIGQNLVILRSDGVHVDQRFLRWAVCSPQWWAEVDRLMNVGAIFSSLNVRDIGQIRLNFPNLRVQRNIAEILDALDDKIAANRGLAHVAFETSTVLHERTYADTDPAVPLGTIATTVLGGTPSKAIEKYWKEGTVPWLNSGKANEDRILVPSTMITEEALSQSAAKLMPVGATVIAITGATLGQVARLEISAAGNQSLVGIWSDDTAHNNWLHFAIRKEIPRLLEKTTGAAQQHVNKRDVDSLLIHLPSPEILEKVGNEISNLLDIASNADKENLSLSSIRNILLPQLMSGNLKVKQAEKIIASAV